MGRLDELHAYIGDRMDGVDVASMSWDEPVDCDDIRPRDLLAGSPTYAEARAQVGGLLDRVWMAHLRGAA